MSFKSTTLSAGFVFVMASAALAGDKIMIMDPYARVSTAASTSGAAFMQLVNQTDSDDRLIGARSDVAKRVELHTHREDANGVMKMLHVEDGFAVPAGETHMLKRGGDHVMLMGLTRTLEQDDSFTLTLTFEKAGDVVIEVPVDLTRKPGHGAMDHSGTKQDDAASN